LLAEKKIRTVFNLLGPLVNPARVNVQLIGVFDPAFTPKFAEVLRLMGHRRAMVVHGFTDNGGRGMDELSTLGPTQISELRADGSIDTFSIDATALGLARARLEDLVGDTPTENAQTLRAILIGKERGPKADMVLLNAAAALVACDKAADFEEGIALARQQIQTGAANAVLEKLIKFTQQVK
jgi:anthranilate phosphoribosyltransferase